MSNKLTLIIIALFVSANIFLRQITLDTELIFDVVISIYGLISIATIISYFCFNKFEIYVREVILSRIIIVLPPYISKPTREKARILSLIGIFAFVSILSYLVVNFRIK